MGTNYSGGLERLVNMIKIAAIASNLKLILWKAKCYAHQQLRQASR